MRHRRTYALAGLLALAGCPHDPPPPSARAPQVRVVTVAPQKIAARTVIAGVLAPLPGRDVKVGALVPGRVDRVFVAEGDVVKLGQPLAHVEAEPLRQHVTEADAAKETARAALENARARLARSEKLWKDGIASRQEVDDAKAQLVAAESALKQAQAGGGLAGVQLERATLRAPLDGVVAAILVPAGQPVDGSGTPVVEIADTRQLDLRAPVAADQVSAIVAGQPAELDVEGAGRVAGKVEAIAPLVDPATNTVTVRVRVDNQGGKLRGGMFARGAILGAERTTLAVPRGALLPGDGGAATQVAIVGAGNKVEHRTLQLGVEAGDLVEVRAGLSPGDRVIGGGSYALPDGAEVEIAP